MASPANVPANTINPYSYEVVIGNTDYLRSSDKCGMLRLNSGLLNIEQTPKTESKTFVRYMQKFLKHYEAVKDKISGYSEPDIRKKVENSLSELLLINAEAMSVELTEEDTLFFTIKKSNYSFYIDQYLRSDFNDDNEFVMTMFKETKMFSSKSGDLQYLVKTINEELLQN